MAHRITKEMRGFVRILINNDYHELRCNGSHFIYGNGSNQITFNKDLNEMVKRRLIKENKLIV